MINFRNPMYQELLAEYHRLAALYSQKIHASIEQWNRQQHEELSRALASVRAEIEQLRNNSGAPALMSIPGLVVSK